MKTAPSLVDLPSADGLQRALNAQRTAPTMALLFHTLDRSLSVITAHRVAPDRKGRVSIHPGRPLTSEDELQVLHLLRPRAQASGFSVLPPTLLYSNGASTMWWLPPQKYPMTLIDPTSHAPRARQVMWPNLALLARQRRLYVVAFAGSERPTADTPCFLAPLANLWANTECCTGSATLPEGNDIAHIDGWTRVLRDTAFSHANTDVIRNPSRTGPRHVDPMAYWRKAAPTAFPDKQLIPLKFALRDWIDFTVAMERRR